MMKISPNSHVRQKDGAQEEEEAGGPRKGGMTWIPMPGADAPTGHLGQRCRMRGIGEDIVGGVGFQSTGGAEVARN